MWEGEATALIYNKSPVKSKNDTSKPIIEHAHKVCDDLYEKIDQKTGPAMARLTRPTPTALYYAAN